VPIPATELSNVRRVPFELPVGTPLQLDLWIQATSAIAHMSLSQSAPSTEWMAAVSFDDKTIQASDGHLVHRFRPTLRGTYQFDWQFYLGSPRYKVCTRLSVAGTALYRRYVAAAIDASMNPFGTIAITFT